MEKMLKGIIHKDLDTYYILYKAHTIYHIFVKMQSNVTIFYKNESLDWSESKESTQKSPL